VPPDLRWQLLKRLQCPQRGKRSWLLIGRLVASAASAVWNWNFFLPIAPSQPDAEKTKIE
jgi:hypothetical protein